MTVVAISDENLHAIRMGATGTYDQSDGPLWSNDTMLRVIERLRAVEWERDQLRVALTDLGAPNKVEIIQHATATFFDGEEHTDWIKRRAVHAQ